MTRPRTTALVILIFGVLGIAMALAEAPPGSPPEPEASRTIWLDIGPFGRKEKAARRLSELHERQAEEGYRLVDVEPYVENGDLEGFWVSYAPAP